jgi:glycosyltransferase involved in cell wall biosynthesis/SAM-dependent methyltransferase
VTPPEAAALIPVTSCPFCGGGAHSVLGERSDGIAVLQCAQCRMGFVAARPADTSVLYSDDYYGHKDGDEIEPEQAVGYSDYELVAAHSLAWTAALVRLLRPDGRVLDVGCANGHLLRSLGSSYETYGIEVNERLSRRCAAMGLRMLGRDICDPDLGLRHSGSFDIVTAIATLEHVVDMRAAVRQIRDLLAPEGVLIFEVPLLSATQDNSVWLQSSLEHISYPTVEGLDHLFREVFGAPLIGREVVITSYGGTFVGLATRSAERHRELAEWLPRLLGAPVASLPRDERAFRLLFDLVHAAASTQETVGLLAELAPEQVTGPLLHRLAELWKADLWRLETTRDALRGEQARSAELDAGRLWLDGQVGSWQQAAAHWQRSAEELRASTSWRLTAPLRLLGRSLSAGMRRLEPGTGPWKALRLAYRLVPGKAKERLLHLALHKGFLRPGPPPAEPGSPVEEPVEIRVQEPWPDDRPLVSVVIPCYNYGHWVGEAIDSVLAQTFQDFEILVVDGGSCEESVQELQALQRPGVQVHYREGRHFVGDNRNFGIARAGGKYICCLDADDKLKPTYLEKALFLLETQGYDVVSTAIQAFGEDTEVYGVKRFPVLADMVQANHVPTCAVFRRDLWERAGGYQDNGIGKDYFYEDWRLWVRCAALGARIANIVDEPLFLYRVHSQSSLSKQHEVVPPLDRQREAVSAFNRDVLTAEAFQRSAERRRLRVEVRDGVINLLRRRPAAAETTILLALPFLIVGGAERLLSEVARHLRSRGYRLIVVTTLYVDAEHGDSTAWIEPATAEIYHLPRFLDPESWRQLVFYLIEAKNVSLLWLIGSAFFYDLLPDLKAAWPHLRVIDLLFNTVGHTANNRRYQGWIDRILVENREVYDWLLAAGEAPERIVQIPSGVDLQAFRPLPRADGELAALGIDPAAFVVGFSGRLSEEKSPETFLEIAERCRDDSRLVFLMTGAGPLAGAVRQRAESLGLGRRFQFLGMVPDVRRYLALYDALVLPSRLDGRPVVVLESLALGVPVVASGVGALPEVIQEGETGFLCTPGDAAAFADRLRWLADHPEEHRRMRAAARSYAEAELSAHLMFQRYEVAIRSVLTAPVLLGANFESGHPEGEERAGRIWGQESSARPDPSARPSRQDDSRTLAPVPRSFPAGTGRPVVLTLPFFTVGGAEQVIATLLARWQEEGRTVVVFTTQPLQPGMADRIADLRALTPYCYPLCELLPPERWMDAVADTLLALPEPALFSVGCAWFYAAAEELRRRVPHLRIVDQLFNAVSHLDLNRRIAASLDATVTAYAGLAETVLADGRPAERVETVYVGIEPPRPATAAEAAAFREQLGVPADGKLVAFIGRLAAEKRPDWIVRLCRELPEPGLRVLIVGDGPLAAVVEEGIANEERLRWLRRVEAIATVYAAADVIVLPSVFEGIPLTLMESLALGRPIVTTRVGGIPELAGTPGLELVDADDFAGFLAAVRRLLHTAPPEIALPDRFFAAAMVRRYGEILGTLTP